MNRLMQNWHSPRKIQSTPKVSAKVEDNTILTHTKIMASNFHDQVWRTRLMYPSIDIGALLADTEYCTEAILRINATGRASVTNLPSQNRDLQRELAQHAVLAIAESWKQNPNALKSKHILKIASKHLKMKQLSSLCPPVNPPVPMKSAPFDHPYLCPPIKIQANSFPESMPELAEYDDIMPEERASWDTTKPAAQMPKISAKGPFISAVKVQLDDNDIFLEDEFEMATPVKLERSASPELVPLTPLKAKSTKTPELVPLTPLKIDQEPLLVPLTPLKVSATKKSNPTPLATEYAETPELTTLSKPTAPSCEISLGWLKNLAEKKLIELTSNSTFLALSDNQLKQFFVWANGKDAETIEKCQKNMVRARLSAQNLRGQRQVTLQTLSGAMHQIEKGKIVGKTQTSDVFPFERKINGKMILILASDHPVEK